MGNALSFAGGRWRGSVYVYTAADEQAAATVSTAITTTVATTVGVTVGASVAGSTAAAAGGAAAGGAAGGGGAGSSAPPGNALVSMVGHVQTFALAGSVAVSNMPPAFSSASEGFEWVSFKSKCPPWKPKCAQPATPSTIDGRKLADANATATTSSTRART